MTTLTTLLVGMHFRPPAKVLVANLPSGTPLYLQAEPTNPYDENAIAVILQSEDIPTDPVIEGTLDQELAGMGFVLEEVRKEPAWHLGYVAATGGKPLLANPGYVGNQDILPLLAQGVTRVTFSVDGAGKAILLIEAND